MSSQLTVFGHPVTHSLSPQIHQAFAKQFDIDLTYSKTDVAPDGFSQAITEFHRAGGVGANVTVPHKTAAFEMCDHVSESAIRAQAVNTLFWQDNGLYGTNTDGPGLVQDIIHNQQESIEHKRLLILGAGGAARGIIGPLLDQSPRSITIANRTFEKAALLSETFDQIPLPLGFQDLNAIDAQFDIIINATSASLGKNQLEIPTALFNQAFVYDLVYTKTRQTPFTQWALDMGARKAVDGLGMLIEQAALGFAVWFDHKPNTSPIFAMFNPT